MLGREILNDVPDKIFILMAAMFSHVLENRYMV